MTPFFLQRFYRKPVNLGVENPRFRGAAFGEVAEQETFSRPQGLHPKRPLAPSPIDLKGEVQGIRGLYQAIRVKAFSPKKGLVFAVNGASAPPPPPPKFPVHTPNPRPPPPFWKTPPPPPWIFGKNPASQEKGGGGGGRGA